MAWECLCEEERTQFGPSLQRRHGDKDTSPINQQMPGSSIRAKGSIYIKLLLEMNCLPLSSSCLPPCPAGIRYATGFQIDSVSYDNQIRDESLSWLPRKRHGEGGGGEQNNMSGSGEGRLHRREPVSPTPGGRPITSDKEKTQNACHHSFGPGEPFPYTRLKISQRFHQA